MTTTHIMKEPPPWKHKLSGARLQLLGRDVGSLASKGACGCFYWVLVNLVEVTIIGIYGK